MRWANIISYGVLLIPNLFLEKFYALNLKTLKFFIEVLCKKKKIELRQAIFQQTKNNKLEKKCSSFLEK